MAPGRVAEGKMEKNRIMKNYNIKIKIFVLLTVFFLTTSCTFKKEPEKVWNLRKKITGLTRSLIGTPYRYGGDDIDGFDCSGLVRYVYSSYGIELPRTAKKQGKLKPRIKLRFARPGDILVFKIKRGRWHSGIYTKKKYFVHAPKRKEKVREEYMTAYWRKRLRAVINIIDEQ